jgi:hypothetical protein
MGKILVYEYFRGSPYDVFGPFDSTDAAEKFIEGAGIDEPGIEYMIHYGK